MTDRETNRLYRGRASAIPNSSTSRLLKKNPLATNLCNSLESGLSILENTNNIRAWWEMELVWNCKHECYNQTLGTFFYKIPSKISKWLPAKVLFSTAALESNQKALDLRKQSSSTSTNSNNSRRNSSSRQFLQAPPQGIHLSQTCKGRWNLKAMCRTTISSQSTLSWNLFFSCEKGLELLSCLQRSSVRSRCIWLLVLETALKARSKLHRK